MFHCIGYDCIPYHRVHWICLQSTVYFSEEMNEEAEESDAFL